jgi:hypothetical protein
MTSASAMPQTLKSISATKMQELSKQRALFESRKEEIVRAASEAPNLRGKVNVLLEGVTRLTGQPHDARDDDDDDDLQKEHLPISTRLYAGSHWDRTDRINIRHFLLQSKFDASISDEVLQEWVTQLERKLAHMSVKYEHATFYSDLVSEWISSVSGSTVESGDQSNFETVGRKEMHEQRDTWESLVFSAADVDPDKVEVYLDRLFSKNKLSRQSVEDIRTKIKSFGRAFMSDTQVFDVHLLISMSKSLLTSNLLSTEKTAILKEFLRNEEVAQEVSDVLNLRFSSLDSWTWGTDGVPTEMRRQLNGKYRVFMDEDLIDALLLHYIGIKWAVKLRDVFHSFLKSPAWKPNGKPIPKRDLERRKFFLGETKDVTCIDDHRRKTYIDDYFMSQLPHSLHEGKRAYDDGDGDSPSKDRKGPMQTKHSLLHLLITESIIHDRLRGDFTVIRSDFKWFGPSLPHASILAILKFFGVSPEWLQFFQRFLECPLKFVHDGPEARPQIRKRGVPISHSISDCLGEAVLFCMDYAVNKHTDGSFLYRLHDDFWFWGEEETCCKAWKAMTKFAAAAGLEFNMDKTGTAQLSRNIVSAPGKSTKTVDSPDEESSDEDDTSELESTSDDSGSEMDTEMNDVRNDKGDDDAQTLPLPHGDIRWGFLRLDPEKGSFVIDQEQVDTHIEELKRQLAACTTIFAWVQAWNSYFARFFSNNFATPSMSFGREHIDMVISTFSRIEKQVFAGAPNVGVTGGVTEYLRDVIAQRFNVHDLPDGFFYFPVELGGLQIQNPFVHFLGMREMIKQSPRRIMEKVFVEEEMSHKRLKTLFDRNGPPNGWSYTRDDPTIFMSLEEYTKHLEATSSALYSAYKMLLVVPDEIQVGHTSALERSQMVLEGQGGKKNCITSNWNIMTPYWKWIAELFHPDMVRKYGGLSAVDRALMPLGVVKVLRQGKVKWQG